MKKKTNLVSPSFLLPAAGISFIYLAVSIYIGNGDLINKTITGYYPLTYKILLLKELFLGIGTYMPALQLLLLFIMSFLMGADTTLLIKRINKLRRSGKLTLTVGGGLVLGLTTGGCAVCGVPLLAFLGIGGSAALLPFHGYEFSFISIVLLLVSFIILIRSDTNNNSCAVKQRRGQNSK